MSCSLVNPPVPQTQGWCAVPNTGNATAVMKSCCAGATVQTINNGCELYCTLSQPIAGTPQNVSHTPGCILDNGVATFGCLDSSTGVAQQNGVIEISFGGFSGDSSSSSSSSSSPSATPSSSGSVTGTAAASTPTGNAAAAGFRVKSPAAAFVAALLVAVSLW